MELIYKSTVPNKEEFYFLYETTGWNLNNAYSKEDLFTAITNSWYLISVYKKETLIGFGRIISDGVYQTFIVDMIVHPSYQGKGIGSKIMSLLIEKCTSSGIKWIQLSCAKGKKDFYKRFDYKERSPDAPGMQKFIR
ncbi:GNAT family N-acetyltransferase [Gracilibacillus kekensis]|uniref:Acetyltransferase (GNAT) family protein n=1 Tax=Gracilibacillus kekensis TaxID=1027249 RepID=A0A1M7IZ78_9BACI|nr:GNAT family N-acetyltransferase [Gracilibacillus kekensis]SHM46018.1 Acetyltransferase (GNAT) family protein [Gracilibacillus kekensis]